MKTLRLLGLVVAMLALIVAMACASDEPGVSAEEISKIVEDAVGDQLSAADVQKIVDESVSGQLSAADVQKIISESIAGQLTAEDVQKIVDASTGGQLTAADVQRIVEASTGEQLSAADVQKIVEASAMGQLTTADVQKIISESITEAVEEAKKATEAAQMAAEAAEKAGMVAREAAVPDFKGTFNWEAYGVPAPTEFSESPMWAAMVAQGELPAVAQRLPVASDVLVVPVVERVGDYGGTWRRAFTGPNDGQNADRLMTDQILSFDLNGTDVIPNLVKGYDVSADGLTYTMYLREGMKWSDGVPFTADDWVWHFDNVLTNEEINPGRDGTIGFSSFKATDVRKVDDYTVEIVLAEAGAGFVDRLAQHYTGGHTLHGRIADGTHGPSHFLKTVHRDFADDKAAYDQKVKDAGFDNWPVFFKEQGDPLRSTDLPVLAPWKVTSPNTSQAWEFERNPYYWAVDPAGNQLPYIDRISMQLTQDKEVLNLRAIAGEIDFQHRHIEMAKVPVFLENAEQGNHQMRFWPSHFVQGGISFNNSYGLGQDLDYDPDPEIQEWLTTKDFRIALSLAVDRNKMNEVVFLGIGRLKQPTFERTHPFYPGEEYALKYTEQDLARANQILDDLGLDERDSDGFRLRSDGKGTLTIEMAYRADYFLDMESISELAQEDFNKVGIKTFLKAEDVALQGERRVGNEHQIYCCEAGGFLEPQLLTEWFDAGHAFRQWYLNGRKVVEGNPAAEPTDPDILRLADLTDEAKTLSFSDRRDVYIEAQKIVIDNQYVTGYVGDTPAFNGVIVMKNYFRNVPEIAPNNPPMQNPGIGRAMQFFMVGGKNDSE